MDFILVGSTTQARLDGAMASVRFTRKTMTTPRAGHRSRWLIRAPS
jgi:hypothetical protein